MGQNGKSPDRSVNPISSKGPRCIALVGPFQSGKTTLLEDLATQLAARGWGPHWVQLNADSRDIGDRLRSVAKARLDRHDAVWVDGAEQVAPLAWPSHINQLT